MKLDIRILFGADKSLSGLVAGVIQPLFASFRESLMSEISDLIDSLEQVVADETAEVKSKVDGLMAQIDELNAKVAQGTITPEERTRLQEAIQKVRAINPNDPTTLPDDGSTPAA